jgi:hypothetical protein
LIILGSFTVISNLLCRQEYLAQNIPTWNTRKIAQVLALASETSSILASKFTGSAVIRGAHNRSLTFQISLLSLLK